MTYASVLRVLRLERERERERGGNRREAFGLSVCATEGNKKEAVFFTRQIACIVP